MPREGLLWYSEKKGVCPMAAKITEFLLTPIGILTLCLVLMNLASFAVYGADKWKAKHDRRRVPEKTLWLLTALGGALGALIGMQVFRHKTQHRSFRWGVPLLLLVQIVLLAVLIWYTV